MPRLKLDLPPINFPKPVPFKLSRPKLDAQTQRWSATVADRVVGWFRVDEAAVATILAQVKGALPTTEAILIGKPQTGKSSIVRALTGVSDAIIGQGYRPHTQHTQRYNFPTDELPLLTFTDTVGLGDGAQETAAVVRELLGELSVPDAQAVNAKIIVLTVKIGDFATEGLRQIVQQVRSLHPSVPCLLAVTCLHESYPATVSDHPAYPPDYAELQRAFNQIQQDFQGLFDRVVLLDFTLESDGFSPVLYGLDAFVEGLAALLPEAESKAIAQLITQGETRDQLGHIYRNVARHYILPFSIMAGALAAVPLPLATMPVLTALQVSMVGLLGKLYGQTVKPAQAGGLVSTIAGGFVAAAIGRELVKFIPGFGSVIAASWATAYTVALGEAACVYFGDLMGGRTPDAARIQAAMQEGFVTAQAQFKLMGRST
jgi:uncharacterized protein (DUF697 family)/predicted GTPase